MFRNLNLLPKIILVVSAIMAVFFVIFGSYAYRHQSAIVLNEAVEKARIVAYEAIRAREYLSRSLLEGNVELNRERFGLIPVVASTRIALLAAEDAGFRVRQVSARYRNPDNKPDVFEQQALQALQQQKVRDEYFAVAEFEGTPVLRYVKPFLADESCLECHGQPEQAPRFIRELYPPETDRAYHYQLGEIIGAASVVIPMSTLDAQVQDNVRQALFFIAIAFVVLVFCLGLLTRLAITRPLARLGEALAEIKQTGRSTEKMTFRNNDEIGTLISGFNEMNEALQEKAEGLEDSERRYRMLTETSRDGIISFLPTGQIILFNRQAEKMFACARVDVLGESVIRLVHRDCERVHEVGIEAYLEKHGMQLIEEIVDVPVQRLDGSSFKVELAMSLISEDDYRFYTATIRPVR